MKKSSLLFVVITLLIIFVYLSSKQFLRSTPAGRIKDALSDIPTAKIVAMKQSASEGYFVTTVEVKDKGIITFSGWSIHPEQLLPSNTRSIGVSQIGNCSVVVIDKGDDKHSKSQRGWTVLDKEIDKSITTIQKAIESYDLIYNTIKSWPTYKNQEEPGKYSKCLD